MRTRSFAAIYRRGIRLIDKAFPRGPAGDLVASARPQPDRPPSRERSGQPRHQPTPSAGKRRSAGALEMLTNLTSRDPDTFFDPAIAFDRRIYAEFAYDLVGLAHFQSIVFRRA
jgi:hypothetical protein